MKILALDISVARTGVCRQGTDGGPRFEHIELPPGDYAEITQFRRRLVIFEDRLCDLMEAHAPQFLGIEAPLPAMRQNNMWTGRLLLGLAAIAHLVAARYEVDSDEVNIRTVKKHWTGSGKADKAAMMKICQIMGWPVRNHDQADAAAVWAYFMASKDKTWSPKNMPLLGRSVA